MPSPFPGMDPYAGYDLSVDYRLDPVPSLEGEDAAWAAELLTPWRKDGNQPG